LSHGPLSNMRRCSLRTLQSAAGAQYKSQGQARSASPLVANKREQMRPEGPKYLHRYFALSGLVTFDCLLPGATRSASLRTCPWLSYLAPSALPSGFHISRLRRCPLAFISRAFGAVLWLSYSAPLALPSGFHIPRLWRCPLAFISRAFGAGPLAFISRAFGALVVRFRDRR
jgi:hypothetical protein